ncbi:MAG: outer membrane beta-barrel protein [Bacteroidota bacterium]
MKKSVLFVLLLAAALVPFTAGAQGKMSLSVGGDLLLPMGTFGDAVGMGFGGSVRGQYDITPMFSAGLTAGYYTWSGKDRTFGTQTYDGPSLSGIPIRAFGKYYFMPEGEKIRAYGIAELGVFIASPGDVTIPNPLAALPGQPATITVSGESSTEFNYAPGVGAEFIVGGGNTKLDVSARYDAIATEGETSGSIGFRVGVNFGLGN